MALINNRVAKLRGVAKQAIPRSQSTSREKHTGSSTLRREASNEDMQDGVPCQDVDMHEPATHEEEQVRRLKTSFREKEVQIADVNKKTLEADPAWLRLIAARDEEITKLKSTNASLQAQNVTLQTKLDNTTTLFRSFVRKVNNTTTNMVEAAGSRADELAEALHELQMPSKYTLRILWTR